VVGEINGPFLLVGATVAMSLVGVNASSLIALDEHTGQHTPYGQSTSLIQRSILRRQLGVGCSA
jgi:hypothetical protein